MKPKLVKLTSAQEKLISDLKAAGLWEKMDYLFLRNDDGPSMFNAVGAPMLKSEDGNAYLHIGDGSATAVDQSGFQMKKVTLSLAPPATSEEPSRPGTE